MQLSSLPGTCPLYCTYSSGKKLPASFQRHISSPYSQLTSDAGPGMIAFWHCTITLQLTAFVPWLLHNDHVSVIKHTDDASDALASSSVWACSTCHQACGGNVALASQAPRPVCCCLLHSAGPSNDANNWLKTAACAFVKDDWSSGQQRQVQGFVGYRLSN